MSEDNNETPESVETPASEEDGAEDEVLFLDPDDETEGELATADPSGDADVEGAASDELDDLFLDDDAPVEVEPEADDSPLGLAQARIAELEEALAAAQAESDANRDRLIRKAADLENARRRHQRDRDEMTRFAGEGVLKDIVPVMDDLDRAWTHLSEAVTAEQASVAQGIEMVVKKFTQTLERKGVKVVAALNQPFDPQYHEAIQQKDDDSVPHNTVVQEFQKGYLLHDRLLRPALVVVAQGGPAYEPPAEDGDDSDEDVPKPAESASESDPSQEGADANETAADAKDSAELVDEQRSGEDAEPDPGDELH